MAGIRPYGYLLEPHLFLAAVGFAAAVNLQRHNLPLTADVSEDLSGRQTLVSGASLLDNRVLGRVPAHLVLEQRLRVGGTHGVRVAGGRQQRRLPGAQMFAATAPAGVTPV